MEQSQNKNPKIGDVYNKDRQVSHSLPMKVCIIEDQEPGKISYIIIDQDSNGFSEKVSSLEDFKKNFILQKSMLGATFMPKKNRAGISNLGNTCYMNSGLQAIFCLPNIKKLFETDKKYGKHLQAILDVI